MWTMSKTQAEIKPSARSSRDWLFLLGVCLLLLWSAWDYGGRYLHVQAFSQVLAGGLGLFLSFRLWTRSRELVLEYPLLQASLLWLLALGLSFIFSVNRLASLEEIWRVVLYLLSAYCVYTWLRSSPEPVSLLKPIVFATLGIACGIAAIGWLTRMPGTSLQSTFNRTNDLAGYLLLVTPLTLHLFLSARHKAMRLVWGLVFVFLSSSLVLTGSRSSWVALIIALALTLFWNRSALALSFYRLSLGLSLLLGVGVLILNWTSFAPRLNSLLNLSIINESATSWRLDLLFTSFAIWKDHLLFGSGPNTFGSILPAYMLRAGYFSINPHNYYVQTLAETGLVGLAAFGYWLISLFRSFRWIPNRYSLGILAGLIASLVHIGFDIDWSVSAIPLLFGVLLGLGLVPETPRMSRSSEALTPFSARPATGLLVFLSLGLILIPLMNFYSAKAYMQAVEALDAKKEAVALSALQRAMLLAPWPSGRHAYTQAQYYLTQAEQGLALRAVLKAIQLDPYNARYYGDASKILEQEGRLAEAEAMLLQRAQNNPFRHPHIYSELGDFYLQKKESQQALSWYLAGQSAFPLAHISQYEHYVPGDRFELFNLYQKLAEVYRQMNQEAQAKNIEDQAQEIIRAGGIDLYYQTGYRNPVAAVLAYWEEVPRHYQDPQHQFDMLHPQVQIAAPPPATLLTEPIVFLWAERDITSARLLYSLPFAKDPARLLMIEDQLQGSPQGWFLISRRTSTK